MHRATVGSYMHDSQDQIPALPFRLKSLQSFKLFPSWFGSGLTIVVTEPDRGHPDGWSRVFLNSNLFLNPLGRKRQVYGPMPQVQ